MGFQDLGTRALRESGILGFLDCGILGFWDSRILGFWTSGLLGFWDSRIVIVGFRDSGNPLLDSSPGLVSWNALLDSLCVIPSVFFLFKVTSKKT